VKQDKQAYKSVIEQKKQKQREDQEKKKYDILHNQNKRVENSQRK